MNKLKDFVMKDFGWKILSVLISVSLWFVVINIENPLETRKFTVPVTYLNEYILNEQGVTITNFNEISSLNAVITVSSNRLALDKLSQNKNQILAEVDLKNYLTVTETENGIPLAINITLPNISGNQYEIISKSHSYVYLKIENIISMEKDITINVTGEPMAGYVAGVPEAAPDKVTVTGAKSIVSRVAAITANVSVDSLQHDITAIAVIAAFDESGNALNELDLSVNEVQVSIPVNHSKIIPVTAYYQGDPAPGYALEGIEINTDSIIVVGNDNALNEFNELALPDISIQDANENVVSTYTIKNFLPEGINLKSGSVGNIAVTALISLESEELVEFDTRELTIEGELSDGFTYAVSPDFINLLLRGSEKALSEFDASSLEGSVNINGLTEGTNEVTIKFGSLPDGVYVGGEGAVVEVIVFFEPEDELSNQ